MARHEYLALAIVATVVAPPSRAAPAADEPALPVAAAPTVRVDPDRLRPGDALLVTVQGSPSPPSAAVAGRELRFFPVAGGYQALAALPVELEPGTLTVEVSLAGSSAPLRAQAEVVEPRFPESRLKVAPRYLNPSPAQKRRMELDQAAFNAAYEQPFGPPLFEEPFSRPRDSEVTAAFGERRLFNGKKQSQHFGTDFAGEVGAPVAAANDGLVVLARDCYASGNTVVVSHGAGLFTVYFHLSRFDAHAGDRVRRGQLLGRVGRTGRVTGPHLHFGTKVGGLYVDPESVYRLRFSARGSP
ncbi:MAG TPA: M23 family metallopeptidase [Anaeromyxobacteraceae bacterium]|nr:M23 family metallopeptidase [Anaeromyxobacteraceae bacterium]